MDVVSALRAESWLIEPTLHLGRLQYEGRLHSQHCLVDLNQLAELFATSKQNISSHIINILEEKELGEISVVNYFFTTAADGKNYSVHNREA